MWFTHRLARWFFEGYDDPAGPHPRAAHTTDWWKVMCLTGIDAFPTLTYQPAEGNRSADLPKFLAFGEGDTAPVIREVLRPVEPVEKVEPDAMQRPRMHVG